VPGHCRGFARRILVPLTGVLLVLGVPATGPAKAPRIAALQQKRATLAAESRGALVELYGLESRLAQAQAALARVDARAAQLARREAVARTRYRAAQRTLSIAQFQLGRQLRLLYQQDEPDPIAIVLGASSLDDAIDGLENVNRTARATKAVVVQSRAARTEVEQARRVLAAEAARTSELRTTLLATAADLERAQVERRGYVERLRHEESLTASQISSLEERARQASRKAAQIVEHRIAAAAEPGTPAASVAATQAAPAAAVPPANPSEPPPAPVESISEGQAAPSTSAPAPPRPGGTMTVFATGYCLRGTTATGLPVAPGIVAVDPAVIPLGTRMTIPGYGEGVAADVGGEIKGARIDVWFASCGQAAAFTRTVTITFR
jgi:3D (Asp-Asp-Asp) domain-containing protein